MLTVLLVLVSLLVVDLLFTRGVQFLTWVRGLDPVLTREVDTVNNDVVRFAVDTENTVASTTTKVVGDLEVAGKVFVKDVTNSVAELNAAKKTLASLLTNTEVAVAAAPVAVVNEVKAAETAVSTVANDVAKDASVVATDVSKDVSTLVSDVKKDL
jgi:predicted PurR-regulated permease PerM